MKPHPGPLVYLVTDRKQLAPRARGVQDELDELAGFIEVAVSEGIDVVQVREPDVPAALLAAFVSRIAAQAVGTVTSIVVNDRADVALVSDADGVHLRASGPPVSRLRALNAEWMIGKSVHPGDPQMSSEDADYLLFGTVFPSASKGHGAPVAGLEPLRALARRSSLPVLAIGGMTPARARECRQAGAAGVAAIGAFLPRGLAPGALGVRDAIREFRRALTS